MGSPQRATVDLNTLARLGVRLVGRFAGVRDGLAQFSGSLPNVCALADLKLGRLLDTIDGFVDRAGLDADPPARFASTELPVPSALSARLGPGGIETIVWATVFRPDLSWLDVGVFDEGAASCTTVGSRPALASIWSACRSCAAASPP